MARVLLLMLLVFGGLVAGSAGAQASCAMAPSLRDQIGSAPLVFVGTVTSTSDNDRVARVEVQSIWKGPDLPAHVEVHGSPVSGWNAYSSVDRRFRAGERDIFVLFSASAPLQDNSCSATQIYTAEIAALAPADARSPAPATPGDEVLGFVSAHWVPLALVLVGLGAAAFIGLRRLRRPR